MTEERESARETAEEPAGETVPATAPTGVRAWLQRHHRVLGVVGAVFAAAMTVLWLVVVPAEAETASGVQEFLIRYGHPAAWALLAVLGVLIAADAPRRLRDAVAYASLVAYLAFLGALLLA